MGNGKCLSCRLPRLLLGGVGVGWRWPTRQITFLVLDQNILDWPIKITFLGKVETAIRPGIKSRFGIGLGLQQLEAGFWFPSQRLKSGRGGESAES